MARSGGRRRWSSVTRHVDSSIVTRVRLFLAIFLVALVVAVVDAAAAGGRAWLFVLAGLVVGVVAGQVASRMYRLQWRTFEQRAVGKIDAVGAIILVLYIAVSVFRGRLVGLWVPPASASATSIAVLGGMMLGQVLGVRRGLITLYRRVSGHGGVPAPPGDA